jgi:hypothetical protein
MPPTSENNLQKPDFSTSNAYKIALNKHFLNFFFDI